MNNRFLLKDGKPLRYLKYTVFASLIATLGLAECTPAWAISTKTEQLYLSGKGPKDAVPWEFTVTGGRRANEQTTIPVPSDWEQHGFGTYNYGDDKSPHSTEHGLYKLKFKTAADWKGARIRLFFGGVMTDATVKVNGEQVGPTHHGGYSPFSFDVTKYVKPGADNVLEVDVSKTSSNPSTNLAERYVDFWVFGGIYRPVWLEATPPQSIEHAAINAKADGTLTADVQLDDPRTATRIEGQVTSLQGEPVGLPFSTAIPAGGGGPVQLSTKIDSPKLWNAETPNLYLLKLSLYQDNEVLHTKTERFGFRTFEVRPGQGFYVNGQRVLLKGGNRMSFKPDSGRALDKEQNYEDVRLMKSLNMNAIRLSMFPQDPEVLDAADELGLYAIDELTSWQNGHDTFVGRLLVRELVERDVNHPSIIFWTNGNEGGWNRDLDKEFSLYDPQKRRVLHPWEVHDDVDTYHYPNYGALVKHLSGKNVYVPTEVLHGLYDGGHGAGLEDYWKAITASPVGGGAFLWSLIDEGLVRTDRTDKTPDIFGTYAADGLVGPRLEKEGSYYTVRDLWSPVQIETPNFASFDGTLKLSNGYDFTALTQTNYSWKLVRFPGPDQKITAVKVLESGKAAGPNIAPHASGTLKLNLPQSFSKSLAGADALVLTATGPSNEELWTWTWPTAEPALPTAASGGKPAVTAKADEIRLSVGVVSAIFDPATGLLRNFKRGEQAAAFGAGPRLVYAKPTKLITPDPYQKEKDPTKVEAAPFDLNWVNLKPIANVQLLDKPQLFNIIQIKLDFIKTDSYGKFKFEISPDGKSWITVFDSTRRGIDGERYNFPPQMVAAIRLSQPVSDAGRPISFKALQIGYDSDRFPQVTQNARITTGSTDEEAWLDAEGAGGIDHVRWTLRRDGSLKLDYNYNLTGDYIYHGVTFDLPQEGLKSVKRLGDGPSRVWQNRLRGTGLMVSETPYSIQAPESPFPEFKGFFSDLRWAQFNSSKGSFLVTNGTPDVFLRVGTPLLGHSSTDVEFPAGDLSFLAAIPAIGSKVVAVEDTGPSSKAAKAQGTYKGSLLFSLPKK